MSENRKRRCLGPTPLVNRRYETGDLFGSPLSPREIEVMHGRADGFAYKEIAGRLAISASTVSHHVSRSLRKLGAQSSLQAVQMLLLPDPKALAKFLRG